MSKLNLKKNVKVTEYAVAYPQVAGADLSRLIPCGDEQEADECRDSFAERGIDTVVVKREISAWKIR